MRVVYLGTPDFAVLPLKSLTEIDGVEVVAVVCNKDKPVGRKKVLTPPPVKVTAESLNIPVYQYDSIRKEGVSDMQNLAPDLMVTCAFGQILSQEILDIPKLGVINIHASLLPKYRGASPIHYALLNGEKSTGVTIMKTDIGIDTGDILFSVPTDIKDGENCGELFERLSAIGADAIKRALRMIMDGSATFTKQGDGATYTKIIKKEDALIDFNVTAKDVVNKVRAFNPAPVAYTFLDGEIFKVYEAKVADKEYGKAGIGAVIDNIEGLTVGCKDGAVTFLKVQIAGGKPLLISDFMRGNAIDIGKQFGL